jgi:hypothetical protein
MSEDLLEREISPLKKASQQDSIGQYISPYQTHRNILDDDQEFASPDGHQKSNQTVVSNSQMFDSQVAFPVVPTETSQEEEDDSSMINFDTEIILEQVFEQMLIYLVGNLALESCKDA